MTRYFTFAAAALLAACMSTTAWSQGGQSGGTSGSAGASGSAGTSGTAGTTTAGQGGTGQFRTQSNVPGQQQFGTTPQPGFNFDGPSQTPFFIDPRVRQQLNLNDPQFNQLNRAHQDAFGRFNQGVTALGNNLTEQERIQRMLELEARFNQEFGQSLDTTFTAPRLRNRFNQLDLPFRGFAAFNDRLRRRQLNLTPQQQRELRRLAAAWHQRLQQLRRAGNNTQLTDEEFAQLQAQNLQQINSVLTPEQREIWERMIGQPFSFPRRSFFGDPDGIPGGPPPALGGTQQRTTTGQQNNVQTGQQQNTGSPALR